MVRPIKFRAWDKENKTMCDVIDFLCMNYPEKYEVMQFTGLLDKSGKEIYEFMELDNQYEVVYVAPKYVLQDISNGDIMELYDNKHTITKEYSKL